MKKNKNINKMIIAELKTNRLDTHEILSCFVTNVYSNLYDDLINWSDLKKMLNRNQAGRLVINRLFELPDNANFDDFMRNKAENFNREFDYIYNLEAVMEAMEAAPNSTLDRIAKTFIGLNFVRFCGLFDTDTYYHFEWQMSTHDRIFFEKMLDLPHITAKQTIKY